MAAPKGNSFARKQWFAQKGEERLIALSLRLPESQVARLNELTSPGLSRSDILREAISEYFQKHGL
jgi:predicted DNA-binding protein